MVDGQAQDWLTVQVTPPWFCINTNTQVHKYTNTNTCDVWQTSWDWLTVQVTPPWWDYDYDYDYFEQSGALMLHIALFVLVCCFCCMLLTTSLVSPSKGSGSETTSLKSETFASFRPRLRKKSFSLCSCSFDNTANEFISNWIHAI